ncbi:MAG: ribosome-associated protein [Flavobacteriales bacterium]|jgi:ribosome-associated protein
MSDESNDDAGNSEVEVEALGIEISYQPLELYKILKLANLVSGGGEAKQHIAAGNVYVNGVQETRKRCKIYADDVVFFNGEHMLVLCDQEPEIPPINDEYIARIEREEAAAKAANNAVGTSSSAEGSEVQKPAKKAPVRRKAIDFLGK